MNIEELIELGVFVNIQPLDAWDNWVYEIIMEDIMSPFYVAYSSVNDDLEFPSYNSAWLHAQEKVNELLIDLDKSE